MMLFAEQTFTDFERIAGTFGVPVVILVAVFIFVIIPITKAQVANLNKVGDAIQPMQKDISDLKSVSLDQADVLKSQTDVLKSLDANQTKLADRLDNVCKADCDNWKPHHEVSRK
jgi:hypothetical protein